MSQEWNVVAQLAFQIQNKNTEEAGDELLSELISLSSKLENKQLWNTLSFVIQCLKFIFPKPSVIQEIVDTCVRSLISSLYLTSPFEGAIRENITNDLDRQNSILRDLLLTENDNRKLISLSLEKLLIEKIQSSNETEAYLALEIIFHLSTFMSTISIEYSSEEYSESAVNFWDDFAHSLVNKCAVQIRQLCPKYVSLSKNALLRGIVKIEEFVTWHGVKSLLIVDRSPFFSNLLFGSIFDTIVSASLEENDTEYIDTLKEIGLILAKYPLPWLYQDDLSIIGDFPSFAFYNPTPKDKEFGMKLDNEVIFGIFVSVIPFIEASLDFNVDKAEMFSTELEIKNISEVLLKGKSDPIKKMRAILLARHDPKKLAQAEKQINVCRFTPEQQDFIKKWINCQINTVKQA